ncbi:MAG: TM2 domain-containing protein [Clostridia bacterium]
MEIEELVESFLVNMGCSISGRYTFIKDDGYNFLETTPDKVVKVGNLNIPLNKAMVNTVALNQDVSVAGLYFSRDVKMKIADFYDRGVTDNNVTELSNYVTNTGKVYFTDFVKYSYKKFQLNEKILQYVMSLAYVAICTLNNNIVDVLKRYQIDLSNAKIEAMNYQNQLNAESMALAINAPKMTFAKTYNLNGWLNPSFTMAYTTSSVSDSALRGSFMANSTIASIKNSSEETSAIKKALLEIGNVVDNVALKFNADLMEILVLKLKDIFNEDVYNNVKDLEKNPANLKEWIKVIDNIEVKDFETIKEIRDYYQVNLSDELESSIKNKLYNYYTKENKCDYDGIDLKLYKYLNNKEIDYKIANSNIYNYLYNLIKVENSKNKVNNKNYNKIRDLLTSCSYMKNEDKQALIKYIDDLTKYYKKNYTSKIIYMSISIVALVLFIVAIALIVKNIQLLCKEYVWAVFVLYPVMVIWLYQLITKGAIKIVDGFKAIITGSGSEPKEMDESAREKTLQIFLCLFFGFIGAHRFYEGDILKGILYAATWGFFGIGIVVDLIRIIFDLY